LQGEEREAIRAAADREERFLDGIPAFVADAEAPLPVRSSATNSQSSSDTNGLAAGLFEIVALVAAACPKSTEADARAPPSPFGDE
jgi:hypothetical protein